MKEYYDTRAPEYDDWYLGRGGFAGRERPGWESELAELFATIEALPAGRTLDVACGTGFLTCHLRGAVVALDAERAHARRDRAASTARDARPGRRPLAPVPERSFDRVFTGHFYGHLDPDERARFLAEAGRVAEELVVVDASRMHSEVDEEVQTRVLDDGSEWEVFKRWFTGAGSGRRARRGRRAARGPWFVVVRSPR